MRCSSCNTDTPGRTLKGIEWRCPNCGHQFVANKKIDGISDVNIKQAVQQVSDAGKLYYLSNHLAYQLARRLSGRNKAGKRRALIVGVLLAFLGVALLLSRNWLPSFIPFALAALFLYSWRSPTVGTDVFELVQRYESVNPPERCVPPTVMLVERERGRDPMLSALRAAPRMLLCQHQHDAEFLVANDFHLQHVCPVVGPAGKALDGLPELSVRLARGGPLDLFVLHDYTPAGYAYMRRIRQLPDVVRRRDPVTLIEMGFDQRHRPLLEKALWPLARIHGAMEASPGASWPGQEGAQVAALRPALTLAAAGASVAKRAPMRAAARDDDRLGEDVDSDGSDSE